MILRDGVIYLTSSLINKAVPFISLPFLTAYFTTKEYGILSMFLTIHLVYFSMFGMGVHTSISKNYFSYSEKKRSQLIFVTFLVVIALNGLGLVSLVLLSLFTENLFSVPSEWLIVLPIITLSMMFNAIYLTILRFEGKPFSYAKFEILNSILFCSVLFSLVYLDFGWISQPIAMAFSYSVFSILSLIIMARGMLKNIEFNFNKYFMAKGIFQLSLPLIPHLLSVSVIAASDRIIIGELSGIEYVGIYAIGYSFGMVVNIFSDAFIKAWSPWFYKAMNREYVDETDVVVKSYLYVVTIFFVSNVIALLSYFLIPYLVDDEFVSSRDFVYLVCLGYFFHSIYKILFLYLVRNGKTLVLAFTTTTSAIVNIFLNFYLIENHGPIGAAYATVICYALNAFLVFLYVNKIQPMPWISYGKQRFD